MNAKLRLAGILAVLLLALGGLATWDEWKTKQEKEDEKTKNKLADFKPEDVLELDYYSKGVTTDDTPNADDNPKADGLVQVSAVKKDGVWRLTKPLDVLADASTIDALIKAIADYSYTKVLSEKQSDWAEYGLLEPQRHITLRLGGNVPHPLTVYFGSKSPVGYSAYFRTSADDKVLVGSQHLLLSSSKVLQDFRDKSLVRIDESKLKNLTYERRGEPAIELTKSDGKYAIVKPQRLEADGSAAKDFIEALNNIRVSGFIDAPDEPTKALFASPDEAITWQAETGAVETLKLVDQGGKILAAFDPSQRVFVLPDDLKSKLKKELVDFRNRRILEADLLDTKSIEIDGEAYKNIEGNWYTSADAGKFDDKGKFTGAEKDRPQEKAHIRALMVDLEFAKTDRFIPMDDPVAKNLSMAPLHRLTLRYFDQTKQPVNIELFKDETDPAKYLVKRSGASFVFRVAASTFNSMTPAKEAIPGGHSDLNQGKPGAPMDDDNGEDLDSAPGPEGTDNSGLNPSPGSSRTAWAVPTSRRPFSSAS